MKRELLLLALVGCGSFDAVDALPGADAGGGDASVDGSSADAPASDASSDAGFCARFVPPAGESTIYCRDFDDGRSAIESWSQISAVAGTSSVELDPNNVSPPFAFRTRIEPNAPNCTYARGVVETGPMRAKSRVAFDVLLGGMGTNPTDGASFVTIQSGTCGLIFSANPSKASVHVQLSTGTDQTHDMIDRYPKAGTWSHVEATLYRDTNELEVAVDGSSALVGGRVKLLPGCLTAASKLQLQFGLYCEPVSTNAREVRLDNAVATGTTP